MSTVNVPPMPKIMEGSRGILKNIAEVFVLFLWGFQLVLKHSVLAALALNGVDACHVEVSQDL